VVAVEATVTVGDAEPGAKGKRHAHTEYSAGEVERCHRVLRRIFDEHLYLMRQLSVFYRHTH
jgi:hypothetical protein